MRVVLDATKCEAYGACADHCPSLFELDEWGSSPATDPLRFMDPSAPRLRFAMGD